MRPWSSGGGVPFRRVLAGRRSQCRAGPTWAHIFDKRSPVHLGRGQPERRPSCSPPLCNACLWRQPAARLACPQWCHWAPDCAAPISPVTNDRAARRPAAHCGHQKCRIDWRRPGWLVGPARTPRRGHGHCAGRPTGPQETASGMFSHPRERFPWRLLDDAFRRASCCCSPPLTPHSLGQPALYLPAFSAADSWQLSHVLIICAHL
jgi:hypothetical protein